ncbi:MAG: LysM peptidoglycan-binding domain-containing protein, partial [Chloroflexi bacterium]|nr:LysM peptidoglycan-binding domain-containing protein [Chloroflexota bacterium]
TYVVQPGDTLYGIAARFGKNVWDIIAANNLSDPYWIWVGQVLTIP